jgi:hypothetical protein
MLVLSSVFVNNDAKFDFGGAIDNFGGGIATVLHCQLTDNVAAIGGGIYNDSSSVLTLGFSWLQTNKPDNLDNLGTYKDLGGNTVI